MARLAWDERLGTGIRDIDDQHRWLLGFFNALDRKRRQSDVSAVLGELWTFSKMHFLTEEVAMLERAYPETDAHRREHRAALTYIESMLKRINEGEELDPVEPQRFLKEWLVKHMAREDARFAAFARGNA